MYIHIYIGICTVFLCTLYNGPIVIFDSFMYKTSHSIWLHTNTNSDL